MQASVKIMNIDVDMMTNDIFVQKMNEYLADDGLNVILFASTEMLNRAVEDEGYRELLEQADLFLPGERALLTTHHVDVLEAGDMVVSFHSLSMMLENLKNEDRTFYIIADTETSVDKLRDYCEQICPGLAMVGSYSYEENAEDAAVVNEINNHTPDMLLVKLPVGLQEQWVNEHAATLNARLCIEIGGVADQIIASRRETPGWVKKLHLDGLYHSLFREMTVKRDMKALLFRKKVVKYNNENEIHDYTQDDR